MEDYKFKHGLTHHLRWSDYHQRAKSLAYRMWSVHPKEIQDIQPPLTREEFYEKLIRNLVDEIFQDDRLWVDKVDSE